MRGATRAAASVAALVVAAAMPATLPAVAGPADRTITGDETHVGPVVVAGRWRVSGTLRLRGADVLVLPGGGVQVEPGGWLIAESGVGPLGPRATKVSTLGDARGIEVLAGGNASLMDSEMLGTGVVSAGALATDRVAIVSAPREAIVLTGGTARIERTTIERAGDEGVRADATDVTMSEVRIDQAGRYAIHLTGGSLTADALTVTAAVDYGVRVDGGAVALAGSGLLTHCGVYLSAGASGTITGTRFETGAHGLTLARAGSVSASGNVFDGEGVGILTEGSAPSLRDNAFRPGTIGVWASDATPVDAELNWWHGVPNQEGAARTIGPVDADPWLTAPPA